MVVVFSYRIASVLLRLNSGSGSRDLGIWGLWREKRWRGTACQHRYAWFDSKRHEIQWHVTYSAKQATFVTFVCLLTFGVASLMLASSQSCPWCTIQDRQSSWRDAYDCRPGRTNAKNRSGTWKCKESLVEGLWFETGGNSFQKLNSQETASSEMQHLEILPKHTKIALNSGPSSNWFPWAGLQCQAGKARLSSSYGIELPYFVPSLWRLHGCNP